MIKDLDLISGLQPYLAKSFQGDDCHFFLLLDDSHFGYKQKFRLFVFFFWGGVFCHFCYFGHLVFFGGGSNTFPPFFSVLLMWSLLKGALLARSLARFARCLAPFLSSAKRLQQIQTSQTNSLSQSRVHLLLLLGFFSLLLMHLELKELIRIW